MQITPCEICGNREATTTLLMVIGRNRRAVRACEPQCAMFVEDVAISIPEIVDTLLLFDTPLAAPERSSAICFEANTKALAYSRFPPPTANNAMRHKRPRAAAPAG